ncbi:MAG: glycosyltransferase family 2 protein [Fimbriimonas ginsengisoli]|nr:glycosyltransferase family 2 protein [Fimbriimonas ginsengisoli]
MIVPAFNEEARILRVLRAVVGSRLADEVLVVDDGSLDRTAEAARRVPGVLVIRLEANLGKGGAMVAGARATDADIVAFVDADLIGLASDHVDQIIRPMLGRECDMCLGVFRGGRFWSTTGQIIFPYISGQRALRRELFLRIPNLQEVRFGVEIAIHQYLKRTGARVRRVVLHGVSNSHKEQKYGLVKGMAARRKMYAEMVRAAGLERRRLHLERLRGSKLRTLLDKELHLPLKRLAAANRKVRRTRLRWRR